MYIYIYTNELSRKLGVNFATTLISRSPAPKYHHIMSINNVLRGEANSAILTSK